MKIKWKDKYLACEESPDTGWCCTTEIEVGEEEIRFMILSGKGGTGLIINARDTLYTKDFPSLAKAKRHVELLVQKFFGDR